MAVAHFADDGEVTASSLVAGSILILAGAVVVCFGTVRYRRIARELDSGLGRTTSHTLGPTLVAVGVLIAVLVAATVVIVGS